MPHETGGHIIVKRSYRLDGKIPRIAARILIDIALCAALLLALNYRFLHLF